MADFFTDVYVSGELAQTNLSSFTWKINSSGVGDFGALYSAGEFRVRPTGRTGPNYFSVGTGGVNLGFGTANTVTPTINAIGGHWQFSAFNGGVIPQFHGQIDIGNGGSGINNRAGTLNVRANSTFTTQPGSTVGLLGSVGFGPVGQQKTLSHEDAPDAVDPGTTHTSAMVVTSPQTDFTGDVVIRGNLRVNGTAYGTFPGAGGGGGNVFDDIYVNRILANIDGVIDFNSPIRSNSATTATFAGAVEAVGNLETDGYVYADQGIRTEGAVWARGIKASEVVATPQILNTSDVRTKTRLARIDNALDRLGQIAGCTYDLKSDGSRRAGVVAQDVEHALPEAVQDVDGTLHVDHGALLGLLVQAVNDLRAEVAEIRSLVTFKG
jgi:hypothetical protein